MITIVILRALIPTMIIVSNILEAPGEPDYVQYYLQGQTKGDFLVMICHSSFSRFEPLFSESVCLRPISIQNLHVSPVYYTNYE